MKFTKMSLVAALLVGSSAFALDNVKMSGDASLFYYTQQNNTTTNGSGTGLFGKENSAADAGLNLNVSADLAKTSLVSISAGAGYTVLSSLGLENNLVSNVWGSSHGVTTGTGAGYKNGLGGAKVENASWMNEAWIAATAGKSTVKIGRMELDTPMVFTEKWSIEKNTFEAAVLINQDIPDTTLVGAFVGNGNGTENFGQDINGTVIGNNLAVGPVVNQGGRFTTFGSNGAYAVAAINNSFKPLTVQAWYFSLQNLAQAYWLQADLNMEGVLVGGQYSSDKVKNGSKKSDSVYALMLGYNLKDIVTVKGAYSKVNKGGDLGYAGFNTATRKTTAQSKLYTEAYWNYGKVTKTDTASYMLSAEATVATVDLMAQYTSANDKSTANNDMKEFALTAGKSFGPLDTTLAYVYSDNKTPTVTTDKEKISSIQAYLTLNF